MLITNSFMHADQEQPRNTIGKNTKEGAVNDSTRFTV
jgi:hypothetical protein